MDPSGFSTYESAGKSWSGTGSDGTGSDGTESEGTGSDGTGSDTTGSEGTGSEQRGPGPTLRGEFISMEARESSSSDLVSNSQTGCDGSGRGGEPEVDLVEAGV